MVLFRTGWKLASTAAGGMYAAKIMAFDGANPKFCSQPNLFAQSIDFSFKLNSAFPTLLRAPEPAHCGDCDICLVEPCSCPAAVKTYRGCCEWKFEFDVPGADGVMQKEQRDGNWLRFKKVTKVSVTGTSAETIYLGCMLCKDYHSGTLASANKLGRFSLTTDKLSKNTFETHVRNKNNEKKNDHQKALDNFRRGVIDLERSAYVGYSIVL